MLTSPPPTSSPSYYPLPYLPELFDQAIRRSFLSSRTPASSTTVSTTPSPSTSTEIPPYPPPYLPELFDRATRRSVISSPPPPPPLLNEVDIIELESLIDDVLTVSTPPRSHWHIRESAQERVVAFSPPPPPPHRNPLTRSIRSSSPIRQIDFEQKENISVNFNICGLQLGPLRDEVDSECSICFESNITSSSGGALPCKHTFHNECISKWFEISINNHTCPCCRRKVDVLELCN